MSTNLNISDNLTITSNELTGSQEASVMLGLRVRRKTSQQWLSHTEIIPLGEPCFSIDTGEIRIGDGINVWSNLQNPLGLPTNLYERVVITDTNGV